MNHEAEINRLVSLNQQLMDEVARLNKAVADEREACWRLCDALWMEGKDAHDCREAIRARGNT